MPAADHTTVSTGERPTIGNDRRTRYLNGILTVNAILLAAIAWSNIAGTSASAVANAAPQSNPATTTDGFPNASSQRLQIVNEIKALRGELAQFQSAVASGRLKVVIANPGDIKLDIDYAKLKAAMKD